MKDGLPEDADEFWHWLNHFGDAKINSITPEKEAYKKAFQTVWTIYNKIHSPSEEFKKCSNRNYRT